MAKHRKESGHTPIAALRESLLNSFRPSTAQHSMPRPSGRRMMAAVVTAGAVAAVAPPLVASADTATERHRQVRPQTDRQDLGAALTGTADGGPSVRLLQTKPSPAALSQMQQILKSQEIERARIAREEAERKAREEAERARLEAERQAREAAERAEAEARAADEAANASAGAVNSSGYAKPTDGTFTSGYGYRWGSSHNGIDLANSIGTPIYSVSGGEVIDAGPASGFGQWIRVQHDDGTITVYGHINTIDVSVGQRVEAGEQIATMGNEGQSTGPHLHFEVIEDDVKIDPLPWLEERGLSVE